MAAPPVAAVRPPGIGMTGAARGGEVDAQLEVRARMPARFLKGKLVEADSRTSARVVLFPTVANAVALAPTLERFARQGRRIIVDSDSDVFAGDGHLIASAGGLTPWLVVAAPPDVVGQWRATYRQMICSADAMTVATPYLGDVYRAAGAKRVFVCPNAIDPDQWYERHWRDTDEPFAVGFAGGPGHLDDLELIRPALEWASRQADVEAVVFGGFEQTPISPFNHRSEVIVPPAWRRFPWTHVPFTPRYERYQLTLSGLLDVGLMPLADTPSNRGRPDSRVCELAMAGALPIVSDAPNYEAWRDTPVLFARDAVRERAMAVREIVLRDRGMPTAVEPWKRVIAELAPAGQRPQGNDAPPSVADPGGR